MLSKFSEKLLRWHETIDRYLPWKESSDPYYIWLSEIIMQQTRVEQGTPYYLKFVSKWPTVRDLALANEDEVLLAWQGLGYYSRARNLHHTAKKIVDDYNAVFPRDYNTLLSLKGIGAYTAAAIMSFAYKQPYAVVDGNVQRVIARLANCTIPIDTQEGKKEIEQLTNSVFDIKRPAAFNQAIMDFGAKVCTPKSPLCTHCVFQTNCLAYKMETVRILPIKAKKTKITQRHFTYFLIKNKTSILINKRGSGDIWEGLYELPLIEKGIDDLKEISALTGITIPKRAYPVVKLAKHVLSHQHIFAQVICIEMELGFDAVNEKFNIVAVKNLKNYGFPRLLERFFNENQLF